jgi:crotonobetainyl-CoA:carnitine CoA-transferase CaiB-like acyl-CoA transferase
VPDRLGLDFETVRGLNDRVVYVYAASFGSSGPDASRPAFDAVMSAMAGGEVLQAGHGNPPQQRQTTDHSSLLGVAVGILLGLRERDRTGSAQQIETTMLASAAYLFSDDFIRYEGKPERRQPDSGQYGYSALYRLYPAASGSWVFLSCVTDREWNELCDALGHGEWATDERFSDRNSREQSSNELTELLADTFLRRTSEEWEGLLVPKDIPCVRADQSWREFLFSEHGERPEHFLVSYDLPEYGKVRQTGAGVNLSRTPAVVGAPASIGEHTRAILTEFGRTEDEIDRLKAEAVVAW